MQEIKPIIFKLNQEQYGIDISRVNAIEQVLKIVRIPNAPSFIKGIINLRGVVVPVFSLREKFGLPPKTDGESKLIITRIGEMDLAIEVDEVSEIQNVENINLSGKPRILAGADTDYIGSIAKVDGNLVIIIDIDNLMSDEESAGIKSFVETQK